MNGSDEQTCLNSLHSLPPITVVHSTVLITSFLKVFRIPLFSQADIPSLTNVYLDRGYAFRDKCIIHTKSLSSSPPSFLDITPTLKRYLPFPLSFTHSSPLNTQTPTNHTPQPPPSFILHRKSLFLIVNIQNCSIIVAHSPLQPLYPRERNRLQNIPMAKTRGKGYGLSVVILVVAFLLFDAFCVVFHWRVYARSNPSQVEQYTSSNGKQSVYDQNIDERQWLYVPRWHQHGRTQR